jgi:hypothetical protein
MKTHEYRGRTITEHSKNLFMVYGQVCTTLKAAKKLVDQTHTKYVAFCQQNNIQIFGGYV